jgi:diguanylate cyclase (GGDEF)-like protein/PAS domain S-box-containing protein
VALAVSAYAATASGRTLDPLSALIGFFVLIAPVVQLILVQRENADLYADLATQAAGFRSMLQESNDVVMTCTRDGIVRYATPSLHHVLGYEPSEIEGTPLADLVHPDDVHAVQSRFAAMFADDQQGVSVQGRARAADGSWRHLESTVSAFREDGVVTGMILNTRDVSDRMELESKLRNRAAFDELTGLLNRASFTDHLTRILGVESASGTFAVLFLDLDDFKSVNDTAGHAAGDDLLAVAATRVRESLRDTDIVARFGGDEFVALVSGNGPDAILEVARRLRRVLALPHVVAGREMIMAASIGVAFVSPGASADDLLRNADLAMYRAKRNGRNRYEVYAPQMHQEAVERVELARLMRHALEDQVLSLHYQPIVDLDTGAVRHLEALLRWQRPDGSYIPPSEFVPVAEDCGLIGEIGAWVLRTALLQLGAWRARGLDVGVAVNLSARQLMDPDLVAAVAAALAASGVPAGALMLEITENVLVDSSDEVPKTLHALRALGVGVALDDFGTGFSSLGYLGRLPVDTLKVDRSFVAALGSDVDAPVLLRTMVNLGNDLGLTVVAEGVETLSELAALRRLGYTCAQGYLLARPLPPEDVEDSVRAGFAATCSAGVPAVP